MSSLDATTFTKARFTFWRKEPGLGTNDLTMDLPVPCTVESPMSLGTELTLHTQMSRMVHTLTMSMHTTEALHSSKKEPLSNYFQTSGSNFVKPMKAWLSMPLIEQEW